MDELIFLLCSSQLSFGINLDRTVVLVPNMLQGQFRERIMGWTFLQFKLRSRHLKMCDRDQAFEILRATLRTVEQTFMGLSQDQGFELDAAF